MKRLGALESSRKIFGENSKGSLKGSRKKIWNSFESIIDPVEGFIGYCVPGVPYYPLYNRFLSYKDCLYDKQSSMVCYTNSPDSSANLASQKQDRTV